MRLELATLKIFIVLIFPVSCETQIHIFMYFYTNLNAVQIQHLPELPGLKTVKIQLHFFFLIRPKEAALRLFSIFWT